MLGGKAVVSSATPVESNGSGVDCELHAPQDRTVKRHNSRQNTRFIQCLPFISFDKILSLLYNITILSVNSFFLILNSIPIMVLMRYKISHFCNYWNELLTKCLFFFYIKYLAIFWGILYTIGDSCVFCDKVNFIPREVFLWIYLTYLP